MNKRDIIIEWIRGEIKAGALRPGDRAPSEYALAARFGVNKTTANKAVTALVAEGALRRGGRGEGTFVNSSSSFYGHIICVMSARHPYYAQILRGACAGAVSRGYLTIFAEPNADELAEFAGKIPATGARGVLTANYGIFPEIDGIPVIHLDRDFSEGARPRYVILPDGALGAKLATEEFLRLGHRNIVMINYSYTAPRSAGFAETLRNAGVPGAAERVFLCPEAGKVAPLLVGEIQKKFPGVTGIVTGSDNIAFFLIAALRASGLKVPEDISVSGFGNVREICDLFDLTSVDQHSFDLGFLAAGRLADLVEKKRPPTPFHELLPCGLVRRHSIWPV